MTEFPETHQHTPPHIYLDNQWYIITASTHQQAPFLISDQAKTLVRDKLKELNPRIQHKAQSMGHPQQPLSFITKNPKRL